MKRTISLLLVLATFLSLMNLATPVLADDEAQETVTVQGNTFNNVPFSNGFRGFCLDMNLDGPTIGQKYTIGDTSSARNNANNSDISQKLKLIFTQCFEEIFTKTDQGYIIPDETITVGSYYPYNPSSSVQWLIYYYTGDMSWTGGGAGTRWDNKVKAYTGPDIPDSGYQITLKNGDVVTFYFMVLLSGISASQDLFAYKLEVTPASEVKPETIEATVKKVWDDADNQDGKRPESLTVTLSNGTQVVLNEDNQWTATVTDLPKYEDGNEILYTWTEGNMPEGYTLTGTVVDGYVTTLTNHYTPETVSVTVKKVWDDANDQDGKRPESLTVTLSNGTQVVLHEANQWTATVTDLPKYEDGNEILYTWTEGNMPEGYTLTGTVVDGYVTTLTNHYTPETVSVTVKKVWDDADNQDGKRPESLTVTLSNGTQVVLNEDNQWTATVTDLPKYEDGNEIIYIWSEEDVPLGYIASDPNADGTTTTLTSSYTPQKIDVSVTKIWDDAENLQEMRPATILIKLFADGQDTGKTLVLSEDNGWTGAFTNLDEKAAGVAIVYTVDEVNVPDGYEKSVASGAETDTGIAITITNTLKEDPSPDNGTVVPPLTGDSANLLLWFALLLVSALGIISLGKKRFFAK